MGRILADGVLVAGNEEIGGAENAPCFAYGSNRALRGRGGRGACTAEVGRTSPNAPSGLGALV